jgi:hypothetical protein
MTQDGFESFDHIIDPLDFDYSGAAEEAILAPYTGDANSWTWPLDDSLQLPSPSIGLSGQIFADTQVSNAWNGLDDGVSPLAEQQSSNFQHTLSSLQAYAAPNTWATDTEPWSTVKVDASASPFHPASAPSGPSRPLASPFDFTTYRNGPRSEIESSAPTRCPSDSGYITWATGPHSVHSFEGLECRQDTSDYIPHLPDLPNQFDQMQPFGSGADNANGGNPPAAETAPGPLRQGSPSGQSSHCPECATEIRCPSDLK